MLAVLAGAGTEAVSRWLPKRIGDFVPAVLVGGTLLMALPLSQVLPWPADFGPTSAARVVESELAGRWLGTTSTADFVPATVDVLPKPVSSLLQDLFNGRELDRVNRASLPPGTAVVSEEVTPLHYRYHSTSDRDYLLRLFLFDFPGWEAAVDGERVEIEIGRPEGFVVVPVPAGEHVIDVHFGNTPARGAAVWVSGLSLVGVVVVGWRLRRRKVDGDEVGAAMGRRVWRPGMAVGAAALMVFLGYLLILNPAGVLRYESANYVVEPAEMKVMVNFGEQIALIGYDLDGGHLTAGDNLDLTLYWQALQPLDINYQVFVHLQAEDGTLVAQSDKLNPGDFPTGRWPVDRYVRDEHVLAIPAGLPPGVYRLSAGLWVVSEGWRLPLLDESGLQVGDHYTAESWLLEMK
jgi:hypothetical protein